MREKHKHYYCIRAYADGWEIESKSSVGWEHIPRPFFDEDREYRVVPDKDGWLPWYGGECPVEQLAIDHYEQALKASWPEGANGEAFTQWNEARKALAQQDRKCEGWVEAAIAWEVCASIHRKWAKGKDALYSTRQADFVKHGEHARAMLSAAPKPEELK